MRSRSSNSVPGVIKEEKQNADKPVSALPSRFKGLLFMALLALQAGTQPIIARKCTSKEVNITSQVIACELAKIVCSLFIIGLEGSGRSLIKQWDFFGAMVASGLPAAIYAIQNMLVQVAYRHLDYLTFNMLNQTKLLFTAFFNFVLLGLMQSSQQVTALFMMLVGATLLTVGGKSGSSAGGEHDESFLLGIMPVLLASMLSGVASSLCQWAIQVKKRSPYLLTIEMSVIGTAVLVFSMLHTPDGAKIRAEGFFNGWTPYAVIPVLTNAGGGILVGLVTKYSGGVKKGFVNISALLVTAVAQYLVDGIQPSMFVWIAMPLVVGSTYAHMQYPYVDKTKKFA